MARSEMMDWIVNPKTDEGIIGNLKGTDVGGRLGLDKKKKHLRKGKKKRNG